MTIEFTDHHVNVFTLAHVIITESTYSVYFFTATQIAQVGWLACSLWAAIRKCKRSVRCMVLLNVLWSNNVTVMSVSSDIYTWYVT